VKVAPDTNRYVDLCPRVEERARQLRLQGTPIPTNDIWISALVLQHSVALHDRDRHFDHLPQIIRV